MELADNTDRISYSYSAERCSYSILSADFEYENKDYTMSVMAPAIAAGEYTATFDLDAARGSPPGKGLGPRPLGLVEGVRRWQRLYEAEPVRAGALGQLVIDGVYRGGECFCAMTFKEWTPAVRDALWPFAASFGEVGLAGRLLTDLAGRLTLRATAGTPAAVHGPQTLSFPLAIVAPGRASEVPLGETARDVPVVFQCFPYVTQDGRIAWFEET